MKNKLLLSALLVLGIIVVVNLLLNEFRVRLDMTEDKQYTLSRATKDILNELEEPVTVKAFFSNNIPPQIADIRKDFKELLIQYSSLADGNLVYEFINPDESEELGQEAMQSGIAPQMVQVREKNQITQKEIFLGASVSVGDQTEVLPVIQPGGAVEYDLTTAIKRISNLNKPFIGWVQGHGEPLINEIIQAYRELSVLYNIQSLPISDTTTIPAQYQTIAIVRPTDTIPERHFRQFDDFLAKGGRIFVALNRVNGDLQNAIGQPIYTGLETWLETKGLTVQDNFVIDVNAQQVTVSQPQQQGFFTIQRRVNFYYLPIITNFADHPITKGLETTAFEFVSDLTFQETPGITYTPLVFSSEKSGALRAPLAFDINKEWTELDFPQQNLALAAALEGTLSGDVQSKMVVIGDGDFGINGLPNEARQLPADNVSLLVNSIDWLSDDTGLIDLRTKGATSRPIEEMEEGTKNFLKYMNFLLPIILVIVYGVFRYQVRQKQRINRRLEEYS